MHKQYGGTLLGVIIGGLLGLGAALSVAVYVTKVPIPFLNKTQSRGAESDAQEAQKNKDWNPNAALAGKAVVRSTPASEPSVPAQPSAVLTGAAPVGTESTNAGKAATAPVATSAAPVPVPAPAPAPAAVAVTPPTPATAVQAKPAGSNDPLGDLAKVKANLASATPVAAPASGADPFSYFIQAGAFRTPEDAEQQRAKLSLMGFQSKITEREQYGRAVYRVRLGPFDKKDEADKTKDRLDASAVETALVRVQR